MIIFNTEEPITEAIKICKLIPVLTQFNFIKSNLSPFIVVIVEQVILSLHQFPILRHTRNFGLLHHIFIGNINKLPTALLEPLTLLLMEN